MLKLIAFEKPHLSGDLSATLRSEAASQFVLEYKWSPLWQLKTATEQSGRRPLARREELWKTTCFEAFIRPKSGTAYWEVNLSLTGDWNIYRFDSPRIPQPPNEDILWRVLSIEVAPGRITARFSGNLAPGTPVLVGLAAVIDPEDGRQSHWALKHSKGQPDFHDDSTFILEGTTK